MAKKILALVIAAMMLMCFTACDDEKPVNDGNEIDVSDGMFFGDGTSDTTDTAEATDTETSEADETGTDTVADTEVTDTDTAEAAE